jgi:hypothetical protein
MNLKSRKKRSRGLANQDSVSGPFSETLVLGPLIFFAGSVPPPHCFEKK